MYAILVWLGKGDNYVSIIRNKNRSVRLFNTVTEADAYADEVETRYLKQKDRTRVISIEGVKE